MLIGEVFSLFAAVSAIFDMLRNIQRRDVFVLNTGFVRDFAVLIKRKAQVQRALAYRGLTQNLYCCGVDNCTSISPTKRDRGNLTLPRKSNFDF